MTGEERRAALLKELKAADKPLSCTALGKKFQVSRQVIVQDAALLRAQGFAIESTNRGYVLKGKTKETRLVKVRHPLDAIESEMNAVVDLGGTVVDVMVNHRTYGPISAPLNVENRRDVKRFLDELAAGISSPLSTITDGYHFHTIAAESDEVLDEIVAELNRMGLLASYTEYEVVAFEQEVSGD